MKQNLRVILLVFVGFLFIGLLTQPLDAKIKSVEELTSAEHEVMTDLILGIYSEFFGDRIRISYTVTFYQIPKDGSFSERRKLDSPLEVPAVGVSLSLDREGMIREIKEKAYGLEMSDGGITVRIVKCVIQVDSIGGMSMREKVTIVPLILSID
jgi:hypothetical protein